MKLPEDSWMRVCLAHQLLYVNGRGGTYEQYLLQLRRMMPKYVSTLMMRLELIGWKNTTEDQVLWAVLEKYAD